MSATEVRRVIMTSSVKSYTLDPVRTFLVCEFIDLFDDDMVNASLEEASCLYVKSSITAVEEDRNGLIRLADFANYQYQCHI